LNLSMQPSLGPCASESLAIPSQEVQVGSPSPFNSYDQLFPTNTDSIPSLGPSAPTSSPRRPIGLPGSHFNSSTQTPLVDHRERLPDHQWSLFGQLMENEGFLSVTPQSTPQQNWRGSDNDYFAQETVSDSAPIPPSIGASYTQHSLQVSSRNASRSRTHDVINDSPVNEYHDSDTYSSVASTHHPPTPAKRSWLSFLPFRQFSLSTVCRNILKCAIAYFIASLFTFSPFFSRIISDMNSSPSASGHMVATM